MTEEEAKKRVKQLKHFYVSLFSYLVVNVVLVIINLATSPKHLWFYWVTIFWGIGMIFHAYRVFVKEKFSSTDWEEKKAEELTKK